MYDAIVIGGGHNGLVCAAYLARQRRRVLVLEGREIVGGYATTEETVAAAPGFRMNPCAVDATLTNIPSSVVDELELKRYGLRFAVPDPWAAHIQPGDGGSIAFWRDMYRTKAEIAKFSKKDAEAFDEFNNTMLTAWWVACAYFMDHPTRPRPKSIGQLLYRAAKGSRRLKGALRIALSSPHQFIEERFEREEVKAGFANLSSWSMLPLEEPGSAGALGIMSASFGWGVTRPIGGTGAFVDAIARCLVAHGGEVRTDAKVAQVDIRSDGTATGVTLESGERIGARQVIGAVDPFTLMQGLVDQQYVPQKVQDELRGTGSLRWNITCLKTDVAISSRPKLACGREELWPGYMLISPTLDSVREAQRAAMYGLLPETVPMAPVLPSVVDRTQVPEGSTGETIYLYLPVVPQELREGRSWTDAEPELVDRTLTQFDDYAPGLKASVIGHWTKTPVELARTAHRGHILHVDMSMHQMGPWRPTPTLSGYRTPIDGLWHTAAGAHPFGVLHGWGGRTTARCVERVLRKNGASAAPASSGTRAPVERPDRVLT